MAEWQDYPLRDAAGTLRMLPGLPSPQLGNTRDLLVYLPPSYGTGDRRYPVLYMHDGQNLFDEATSFGREWEVQRAVDEASGAGSDVIVVGIPNMGEQRIDEYAPWPDPKVGGGRGDDYLRFLVDTVKPLIDADFRTRPERAATGIAGSSMGGLISLYGFLRHPSTFGFCGAMSPSLWFAGNSIFPFVETASFVPGRIYLDVGTHEGSLAVQHVAHLRELLLRKGYRRRRELLVVVESGGRHEETAWARRLGRALQFLLSGMAAS